MNNNVTIKKITEWVRALMMAADNDEDFLISWYNDTMDDKISIVGGWSDGFSENYSDLLYISESEPNYAMCVKIIENKGSNTYADFDSLTFPTMPNGEVEEISIVLEREDKSEALAQFLFNELERLTAGLEE